MQGFNPGAFVALSNALGILTGSTNMADVVLNKAFPDIPAMPLDLGGEQLAEFGTTVNRFEAACANIGMTASLSTIRKITAVISKPPVDTKALIDLAHELHGRLTDEMTSRLFFALGPKEAEYYRNPTDWIAILTRFPECVGDVQEACKCFALSRYAATVFHSLQVVEHGLIELGRFIDDTDPNPGWNSVGKRLKKIIATDHKQRSQFERQNFAVIEQIQGTIESLNNAWRNKVSHAHGKLTLMTADMSPEIAEEILFASRAFMRRLSDCLPVRPPPELTYDADIT